MLTLADGEYWKEGHYSRRRSRGRGGFEGWVLDDGENTRRLDESLDLRCNGSQYRAPSSGTIENQCKQGTQKYTSTLETGQGTIGWGGFEGFAIESDNAHTARVERNSVSESRKKKKKVVGIAFYLGAVMNPKVVTERGYGSGLNCPPTAKRNDFGLYSEAFLEMADELSAAAMVQYFSNCMAQLRGRAVYVQFSNHKELKTDQSHSNAVSTCC
ncbi:hypothetical protein AAG570_004938 [Ranatra chinensis]|uniref:Uncharacterized protein n=1 Tax=Ranatra chinensis TaxID=642074 RepID=A0ABD0YMK4_9HEMI